MKKFFILLFFALGVVFMNAAPPPDVGTFNIDNIEIVADNDFVFQNVPEVSEFSGIEVQEVAFIYIGNSKNESAIESRNKPIELVKFAELTINNNIPGFVELNKPPSIHRIGSANNNLRNQNRYKSYSVYPLKCYNI